MTFFLLGFVFLAVILFLYRLVRFVTADADLSLLSYSLKPEFFKDKVVWVTGASSGIGEELCKQLSRLGAKVILSARSEYKLRLVLNSLAHPENSRIYLLDLNDRNSVNNAPQNVKSLFGRVDILINNAGVSMYCGFLDITEDTARKLMEIDLLGTSFLTKGVIKETMLDQGKGHIVNISSIAGKYGSPTRAYYCAAKFGLIGLMDGLRYELLDKNICITNVCPGPVNTSVDKNALTAQGTILNKKTPLIENGMKVERCVELTLISICNELNEVWISKHPHLLLTYFFQYMPAVGYLVLKRRVYDVMKLLMKATDKRVCKILTRVVN